MSQDAFDTYGTDPALLMQPVRLLGTGAAAPTRLYGKDVTATRTGVGVYVLTWREFTGAFVGVQFSLQATTTANVKNCHVTFGAWNATTRSIELSVWSSAGAARELAALEWINLQFMFQPQAAGL